MEGEIREAVEAGGRGRGRDGAIFRDIRRYYCEYCGICRSKKSLITSHILTHHKVPPSLFIYLVYKVSDIGSSSKLLSMPDLNFFSVTKSMCCGLYFIHVFFNNCKLRIFH